MSDIKLTNIPQMTVGKVVDKLSNAYSTVINNGVPIKTMPSVMLWGPPGVGKSQAIRQIAKEIEYQTNKKVNVKDVRLLLFNPIDLRGIPTSNADKTLAIWLKPQIFQMDDRQVARHYVDSKFKMNEIEPRTYRRYTDMLKRLESISDTRIIDANAEMLLEFLQTQLDYSQSSIRKIKELLYNIFEQAIHMGVIKDNPMKYVKTPKSNKKTKVVRALTIEEQIKLTKVLIEHKPTYWEQMLISLYTGMRMGEVNALTYNDINLNFGFIFVCKTVTHDEHERPYINNKPKTDAGKRQLPINNTIKSLIIELKSRQTEENGDELIFHPKLYSHLNKDKIVSTSTVNDTFKRILKKYDILDKSMVGAVSLHSLRHTYATRCVEAKISVKVLQVLLGHTEIETTLDIYTTIFPDYKDSSVTIVDDYLNGLKLC